LDSPSIIPILTRVEFDIDRRKAGWYEPWLRSRRMNQLKRSECGRGKSSSDEKAAPIQLKLAGRIGARGVKPLFESPEHTDTELEDPYDRRAGKKVPPPLILPSGSDDTRLAYLLNDKRDVGVYDDFEGLGEFLVSFPY
jgi:hypothetical protein